MDDEKRALAGELALGLLDGEDREEALRALDRDPDFREAVRNWSESLVPLTETVEAAPPAYLLGEIEARLFDTAPAFWPALWRDIRAPENRPVVAIVAAAKLALIAWLLYLFM
ncbi:MAG: hypothetical protein RIG84_13190 [Roseovarius sp.]